MTETAKHTWWQRQRYTHGDKDRDTDMVTDTQTWWLRERFRENLLASLQKSQTERRRKGRERQRCHGEIDSDTDMVTETQIHSDTDRDTDMVTETAIQTWWQRHIYRHSDTEMVTGTAIQTWWQRHICIHSDTDRDTDMVTGTAIQTWWQRYRYRHGDTDRDTDMVTETEERIYQPVSRKSRDSKSTTRLDDRTASAMASLLMVPGMMSLSPKKHESWCFSNMCRISSARLRSLSPWEMNTSYLCASCLWKITIGLATVLIILYKTKITSRYQHRWWRQQGSRRDNEDDDDDDNNNNDNNNADDDDMNNIETIAMMRVIW